MLLLPGKTYYIREVDLLSSLDLANKITDILDDGKAEDIIILDMREVTIVADYFVITTATSEVHMRALAEAIDEKLSEEGIEPFKRTGGEGGWKVLDYGSIIIHLFMEEMREYYALERLWGDAERILKDTH